MKIIIEGTEKELRNTLSSAGVSKKVGFDDGSRFICGDLAGRRVRHKKAARSFDEFKAQCEEVAENFYSGSENTNSPEPLSKGCKPAPLSASKISKRNAIYDAVQHRNKEYAAQLSDEECLKVSLILEMLCGSNIKDSKKILDFCNTMLTFCHISSF